jgi:hypothetical protein
MIDPVTALFTTVVGDITIVIKPALDVLGRRHHDRFEARIRDRGEAICPATRQPLLDSARVLLAGGCDPNARITMVWHHRPETVAMTAIVGTAPQFDVMACRFVRRKVAQPGRQRRAQAFNLLAK